MKSKALKLAAEGYPVFPVFPGPDKVPALPKWQKLASTDHSTIEQWWSGNYQVTSKKGKRWTIPSDSNIGIHTTGMCVIDVDVKDGTDTGLVSLKQIPATKTLINKTVTGGLHILFKLPAGVQVGNRGGWMPNIDIRGDCGYIVAPGSIIDNKEYEWVNPGTPIAMIPPDLLMKIGVKAPAQSSDMGAASAYADIPDVLPAGSRDDTVYRFCCSWRAMNISRDDALIKLKYLFDRIEQPAGSPFTWAEAVAKLDQAWLKPAGTSSDQVVAQVLPNLVAPVETAMTLPRMLETYVFIVKGSLVGNLVTKDIISLSDFVNQMKPCRIPGPKESTEMTKRWMPSAARQECIDTIYYPDGSTPIHTKNNVKYFNTYRKTDLKSIATSTIDQTKINIFLDHLKYIFPDVSHYNLFLDWAAFTIQTPEKRIPWCFMVISSAQGVGKQPIFTMMSKCVGSSNSIQVTKQALSDNNAFNDFMSGKKLVAFDEIRIKNLDFDKLKFLITAPEVEINHKYGSKGKEDIYANLLIFTNHSDALKIEKGDRRFFVSHHKDDAIPDPEYYNKLWHAINETDMPAHFLSFLKARDISGFKFGQSPPMTIAKQHMSEVTADDLQVEIEDMLDNGTGPCLFDVTSAQLIFDYLDATRSYPGTLTKRTVAVILASASPKDASLKQTQYKILGPGGKRPTTVRCKVIRNADKWRNADAAAVELEFIRSREAVADTKTRDQIIEETSKMLGPKKMA